MTRSCEFLSGSFPASISRVYITRALSLGRQISSTSARWNLPRLLFTREIIKKLSWKHVQVLYYKKLLPPNAFDSMKKLWYEKISKKYS